MYNVGLIKKEIIFYSKKITIFSIPEPLKITNINTFRDNPPFFLQQKKNRFLSIFFVIFTEEKMKKVLLSGCKLFFYHLVIRF